MDSFRMVAVLSEYGFNHFMVACLDKMPDAPTLEELELGKIRSNPNDNDEGNPSAE